MVFQTTEEVRVYVAKKWGRLDRENLRSVRRFLHHEAEDAPLLLGCVPKSRLAQGTPEDS